MRRLLPLLAALLAVPLFVAPPAHAGTRPNLLLVVSDDQTWETFTPQLMPNVTAAFDDGTTFTRGYLNDSLCCPSRATMLSGLYSHHTRVDDNSGVRFRSPTFVAALHDAGYRTALVGKYLNVAPCTKTPAGWDLFVCTKNGPHLNATFYENGASFVVPGSSTAYMVQRALGFIDDGDPRPWFVMVTPISPHTPDDDAFERPDVNPAFDPGPAFGVPGGIYTSAPWTATQTANRRHDEAAKFTNMARSVAVLDDDLAPLWPATAEAARVYLSDNGFMFGQHQLSKKRWEYEESVNVPFLADWPGHWQAGASDALVGNVDLAATFTAAAGVAFPHTDGHDLGPLLTGERNSLRSGYLIEACYGAHYPCALYNLKFGKPDTYDGVVEAGWKFVEHPVRDVSQGGPVDALYDLSVDPHETTNLASSMPDKVASMRGEARALLAEATP